MIKENNSVKLSGYRLLEQLYCGSKTVVYRAQPEMLLAVGNPDSVVIKLPLSDTSSERDLLNLQHQYNITASLDLAGVIRPYKLETYRRGYALVMEDFGGVALSQYQSGQPLSLTEVLKIGMQLAEILHGLHQRCVIHKDINPAHILIHPSTRQVKLIDFGCSSQLPRETPEILHPHLLEGTLAYLSPEQTGRMNRGVDYRTDFYALGVTLYELCTGQLPFVTDDAMELLHCHLAKTATPLNRVNPHMPMAVAQIVAKLMAKNVADRYQSALGLKHDLEQCWNQYERQKVIADFDLGQRDLSDRFLIPEKLYGRVTEVQMILDAFDRVTTGNSELLLVAGFSGIGKTAVVNEIHKPVVRQRGYFIKGKYDQFNRNIPLFAFVQALRDLIGQLLSESDAQLAQWQAQILAALGDNAQVLIELLPELEQVIGQQPPAVELSASAAQNRFNLLFQKFIAVLATPQHPLVLFLDDLQWADLASLDFIKLLMNDNGHLLILGAYRDHEVLPTHPLALTLEELKKAKALVNTVTLAPLNFADVNQLVADTLHCPTDLAQPLSKLVDRQTQGNPFFTIQLLKTLHEEGYIYFDADLRYWECDIAEIDTLTLTANVMEFMAMRLQKLPASTQQLLKLAACVGNRFDLQTLAIISEKSLAEVAKIIWTALVEGLILPTNQKHKFSNDNDSNDLEQPDFLVSANSTYRFLHDYIQQAACSLISENQRQSTHLQIGRLLLAKTASGDLDSRVFEIVNQINLGLNLVTDRQERAEIVNLNYVAGQKAYAATAYTAALNYWKIGISLLDQRSWEDQYELTLTLHQSLAAALYVCCHFQELDDCILLILKRTRSLFDKIPVYEIQISSLIARHKIAEGINIGLQVLRELKIDISAKANLFKVILALGKTKWLLRNRKIGGLLDLPNMQAPKALAAMQILSILLTSALIADPLLFVLILCVQIELSLRYGNHPRSALAYACYGTTLCGFVNDIESGHQFGQLAIRLLDRFNAKSLSARVLSFAGLTTMCWKQHLKDTIPLYKSGYASGVEAGDLEAAAWNAINESYTSFYMGTALGALERQVWQNSQAIKQLQQFMPLDNNEMLRQVILNLLGQAATPSRLVGEAYDEEKSLQDFKAASNQMSQAYLYISKLMLCYLLGEYEAAWHALQLAEPCLESVTAMPVVALFHFYSCLTKLAICQTQIQRRPKEILPSVLASHKKLKHWAKLAPMNFQHKSDLVAAEYQRLLGQEKKAIDSYESAIAGAKTHGYLQEEAMANELAAKFYLNWGKLNVAKVYMQAAYDCYQQWGATAKIQVLANCYPQLLNLDRSVLLSVIAESRSSSPAAALNVATFLKASQAISGEIELQKLLDTLLNITLANAGADRGVLLLRAEQGLQIVALLESGQQTQVPPQPVPLEVSEDVVIGVVNAVQHNLEPIILGDVRDNAQFAGDRYLRQHQPRSVLCSPILHQGKLVGVVYLENRLTGNVFTRDCLDVVAILCSQAAIALENARLFHAEQEKAQALQSSLEQLQQSELRFQYLFEKSTDAIMLLESDTFIDCNPAAVQLFGYSHKSQLCNQHPSQISPEFQLDGKSSFDKANELIALAITSGSHRFEWIHQRSNHETFWAEVVLTPILWQERQVLHAIVRDISDRKQIEISLTASEAKFRSLVEDASDIIYAFNLEGIFTYLSPQIADISGGWQPADIIGRPCADFTHPEDVPLMLTNFQQLLQTGQKQNGLEMRIPRKNGGWCWVVFNNSPIKDAAGHIIGVQGIGRDVTAQKAALAERQRQADALQAIVEGTVGKTGEAFYQACTRLLAEIFKVKYAFLTKLPDQTFTKTEILSFWAGEEFLQPFVVDLEGTPCLKTYQNSTITFPCALRSYFPASPILESLGAESYMSVVIQDFEGNILGNLAILDTKPLPQETSSLQFILQLFANRVAAEMKRQVDEDELRATNQQLGLTVQELQQATRLKDEFLATMSHELRTPLNAILGMSEVLQEEILGEVNDQQLKSLRTIERSGRHLLSLITDILDVSKISAGKLELNVETVDVGELCKSSLALVKQQAYNKHIRLDIQLPADAGLIAVDERRMRQVLINLLSNAVKFTNDHGFVTLTMMRQERQAQTPGWLKFAVTDSGIGIAPEDCKKLFKPFVQLDSSLNRQYEGTGLGLMLVKQIVELHGGSILLESEVGQGSCFTVHLPQNCLVEASQRCDFDPFDSLERSGKLDRVKSVRPPTILLAEDNEANIETFVNYLTARGYQMHIATNGRLAIELAQQEQPDLILMDIQMPEMDGIEAIGWIRQNPQLINVPIIALTALAMEEDRERCLVAGANDYLAKPITLKQLYETIQKLLEQNG